jgi:hypothetical protein
MLFFAKCPNFHPKKFGKISRYQSWCVDFNRANFTKKYSAHQKLLQKQKFLQKKNITAGRSPQRLEMKNRR